MSLFKKAERQKIKFKGAITGPSGSGKTLSALLIASGLGKKIAVLDSENGSASLYADRFEFETLVIRPPYTVQRYIDAMKAAEAEGFDVLIVDSLSHGWASEGGILDKKAKLDARGGNSFTNWSSLTPEQEQLKTHILHANIHMICTMRSKQEYVIEQNDKGKSAPRKVGLAPIQRDGMEYEFTIVFDMAMDHSSSVSKDRTGLFDGLLFKPTKSTGETIIAWLAEGKEFVPAPTASSQPTAAAVRPTAAPPPVNALVGSGAFCMLCESELVLSSSGAGYYCVNYKDKEKGEHSRLKFSELAEFKAHCAARAGA